MATSVKSFAGCAISIDCGETLGAYQGNVSSVDDKGQTISLVKAFRNGLPCQVPEITIRACDIQNLKILNRPDDLEKPDVTQQANAEPTKAIDTKLNNCQTPPRIGDPRLRASSAPEPKCKPGTPRKGDSRRPWPDKDDDCLNTPIDSFILENDFDFEKNLALFDKQAIFGKISAATRPDVVRLVDINRPRKLKYRCEEHVLEQQPIVHRQIKVPHSGSKEYVTDAGLILPCISLETREKILSTAIKLGFTCERQLELIGRAASDMVLQLLGGSHRLNPRNSHQRPSVVIMCGSCLQGVQALSCGRHLANHEVNVTAYVPDNSIGQFPLLNQELSLFRLTDGKIAANVHDISNGTTDIIVWAMDAHSLFKPNKNLSDVAALDFIANCKAPILSLDPPADVTSVQAKWALVPVLPLDFDVPSGSLYLCDLAIPKKIFSEVGISYQSPFGPKCVIPLHANAATA